MNKTALYQGQASYCLREGPTRLHTTVLGGHTVADFDLGGRTISPFFVAPWWSEGWSGEVDPLINMFRGNFFCLPLGGDPTGVTGETVPIHGGCANRTWDPLDWAEGDGCKAMHLFYRDAVGTIDKELRLYGDQTIIYECNTVSGCRGDYPVGYHPTLLLPEAPGGAHLAVSAFADAYTTFTDHEQPENGGYSLFANAQHIEDLTRIRTRFGDTEDFTSLPVRPGFEDVFMTVSSPGVDLAYLAVTYREEGYVYFQLKNPNMLGNTMYWVSGGGRRYPPWNGRCRPVLGLEETTSFYHYGVEASRNSNPIQDRGHATCFSFEDHRQYRFPLVYGVAAVPEGFRGVSRIERGDGCITIHGLGGEVISQPVDLSFMD